MARRIDNETTVTYSGSQLPARMWRVDSAKIGLGLVKSYKKSKIIWIDEPLEFTKNLFKLLSEEEKQQIKEL